MRSNMSGLLNTIKVNHSNCFVLTLGDHNGTFNKNTEKIIFLFIILPQFQLNKSIYTIITIDIFNLFGFKS